MNQQKQTKKGQICLLCALAAALLFLAATCLVYIKNSDITDVDGIHKTVLLRSNIFTYLYSGFAAAALICLAVPTFLYRKHSIPVRSETNRIFLTFLRAGVGISLLFLAAMQFLLPNEGTPYVLEGTSGTVQIISLFFAVFGSAYFLVPLFFVKLPGQAAAIMGFMPVLFGCTQLLINHYYTLDFFSSPTRILTVLCYCVLIFFFLSEIRTFTPGRIASGFYTALGLIAFVVAMGEAGAKLVLCLTKRCGFGINTDTFYILTRLFMGIYALVSVTPTLLYGKKTVLASESSTEAAFPDGQTFRDTDADIAEKSIPTGEDSSFESDDSATPAEEEEDIRELPEDARENESNDAETGFIQDR